MGCRCRQLYRVPQHRSRSVIYIREKGNHSDVKLQAPPAQLHSPASARSNCHEQTVQPVKYLSHTDPNIDPPAQSREHDAAAESSQFYSHRVISRSPRQPSLELPLMSVEASNLINTIGPQSIPPPTSSASSSQSVLKLGTTKKPSERKKTLACLFCRERKIACGKPPLGSLDKTCRCASWFWSLLTFFC